MKKVILSGEHLVTAVMLAFVNDVRLSCAGMGLDDNGALQANFAMDSISRSNTSSAAALKTLAQCGIKIQHTVTGGTLSIRVTMPYEVMTVSGVIFVRPSERELVNLVCAVAKAMLDGRPVVTMQPLIFEPRCCSTAGFSVRYISEAMPDSDRVANVINLVARAFNGDASRFSEDIYEAKARLLFTLDHEEEEEEE